MIALPAGRVDQGAQAAADATIGIVALATGVDRAELGQYLHQRARRKLVRDVGFSTLPTAKTFPNSRFSGCRLFYNASTMICVPISLSQEVGEALGAQADVGRFLAGLRATAGPFNLTLEARP